MPFHALCCRLSVVLQPCVSLTIGALAYVNKWALQNVYQFQRILGNQKISRFLIGEQAPVEATADAFRVPLSMTYLRNCHPRPYQCPTTEINSLVLDAVFLPSDSVIVLFYLSLLSIRPVQYMKDPLAQCYPDQITTSHSMLPVPRS